MYIVILTVTKPSECLLYLLWCAEKKMSVYGGLTLVYLCSIMKVALENGMGFETASIGELTQSLNTGADPSKIVFDSPVKTRRELQKAIEIGTHVNFDNWQVCPMICHSKQTNVSVYRHICESCIIYIKSESRYSI